MALSVIGAGFGRTGTHSLNLALEILGFGPCHHMEDVMASPQQKAWFRRKGPRDFEATLKSERKEFRSIVCLWQQANKVEKPNGSLAAFVFLAPHARGAEDQHRRQACDGSD